LQTQDAVPPVGLVVTSLFSCKVLVDSIVVCLKFYCHFNLNLKSTVDVIKAHDFGFLTCLYTKRMFDNNLITKPSFTHLFQL